MTGDLRHDDNTTLILNGAVAGHLRSFGNLDLSANVGRRSNGSNRTRILTNVNVAGVTYLNNGRIEIADGLTLSTDRFRARADTVTQLGLSANSNARIVTARTVIFEPGSTIQIDVTKGASLTKDQTYVMATAGNSVIMDGVVTDNSALFRFTHGETAAVCHATSIRAQSARPSPCQRPTSRTAGASPPRLA